MHFPSTIIVSQTPNLLTTEIKSICQKVKNKLEKNNPDLFIIDENSGWGIETVRVLFHFLSRHPLKYPSKVIVIYDAFKLSTEAQNALLKILEDPGLNNFIILTTNNLYNLLPTILSRCHLIKLKDGSIQNLPKIVDFNQNTFDSLSIVDNLLATSDKDKIDLWLSHQIRLYQKKLLDSDDTNISSILLKFYKCRELLKANVDSTSTLDWLFLS